MSEGEKNVVKEESEKIGFGKRLKEIITANIVSASDKSRKISFATQEKRRKVITACFAELKAAGYRLKDPSDFANRHMVFLARKWEQEGLEPSTIQNKISIMRLFSSWINKKGMILPPETYVSDPASVARTYVAVS